MQLSLEIRIKIELSHLMEFITSVSVLMRKQL